MKSLGCIAVVGILVLVAIVAALSATGIYNGLVEAKQQVDAQWAQVENAYKNQFGRILDDAAGQSGGVSEADLQKQLGKAAQEADGLLAQSAG